MNNSRQTGSDSELFMVRLWKGESANSDDAPPLMGRIQHVLSGSAHNFSSWAALISFMQEKLQAETASMTGVQSVEEG